jgi:uncharacterized protein
LKTDLLLMEKLQPVHAAEREIFMDALRGFAILGIFIANLNGFSWYDSFHPVTGPYAVPGADDTMFFLHHLFIEGKFYTIFSLLFGWGIAMQVKRGLNRGINPMPLLRRRLFFMLLLGAVHLLMWPGDIVFLYALLGFALLPLSKFSNRTLLITGVLLTLLPILLYAAKMQWSWANAPARYLFMTGERLDGELNGITKEADFYALLQEGSWWQLLKSNVAGFFIRYGYLFFVSRIPKVLGIFLIGYVIGRTDFYRNLSQNKKWLGLTIAVGLVIGLPANYFLAKLMSESGGAYFTLQMDGLYQTIAYALGVAPLGLLYVALLMLLSRSLKTNRFLNVLAPVGKMAFSNYIFQTLVGSYVFLGAGLGYVGKVGPVYYTLFGVAVFIFQVIASTIWLRFFHYGPVEWLWRSATYNKWQPFRK